jgi:hypothetical protein
MANYDQRFHKAAAKAAVRLAIANPGGAATLAK